MRKLFALALLLPWVAAADLPPSGAISIGDIAGEFGGSAPYSLSDYYRGGNLVPNVPSNEGIPTSGAISLSDFYGAGGYTEIALTSASGGGGAVGYFANIPSFPDALYGAVSPNTLNGNALFAINAQNTGGTTFALEIIVGGTVAQNFWDIAYLWLKPYGITTPVIVSSTCALGGLTFSQFNLGGLPVSRWQYDASSSCLNQSVVLGIGEEYGFFYK